MQPLLGRGEGGLHFGERRIDLSAERGYGCDASDCNQRDDEGVFNERGAIFVDKDAFEIREHEGFLQRTMCEWSGRYFLGQSSSPDDLICGLGTPTITRASADDAPESVVTVATSVVRTADCCP
jgi:hypothetical protein